MLRGGVEVPVTDSMTPYGFVWGPMEVIRAAYIQDRGYVVEIITPHARLQVHVTERGRKVEAYRPGGGKMREPEASE